METKTVYIVEDELGIRQLLKEIIEAEGFDVKEFETGMDALNNGAEQKPDLMFVDYNLPIMNGMELVNRLISEEENIPVIMMSGFSKEELELNDAKITKLLQKPFEVTEIISLIHENLD